MKQVNLQKLLPLSGKCSNGRKDRLHYERYDGIPLTMDYKDRYWGAKSSA